MECLGDLSDLAVGRERNWLEVEDQSQYESENVSVQPMNQNLPEQEVIFDLHEAVEQATPELDLNNPKKYLHKPPLGVGNGVDLQHHIKAARDFGAECFRIGRKLNSSSYIQSNGQWAQADYSYAPDNAGAIAHNGGNDHSQEYGKYFGMDNQWHPCLPPQVLQTGENSYSAGNNHYGSFHPQPSPYPAFSSIAGACLPGLPLEGGAGSPLKYLYPSDAKLPPQTQQSFPHTASAKAAFQASPGAAALASKPASRASELLRASRSVPASSRQPETSRQPATSNSESNSDPAAQSLFTVEDFLPKPRKGGKLLENGMTWNKEALQNHYDLFARKYGLPAVPQQLKGGPSRFKLRSDAVDALTDTQKELLQDFVNAAKFFATRGQPNRPNKRRATTNLKSDEMEENELGSVNQNGKYRQVMPKKRSCEEGTSYVAPAHKRVRSKSSPAAKSEHPRVKSQPSVKNPQGQMLFSNFEEANEWLASLDQPTILETANMVLANLGIPSVHIASPRQTGFPPKLRHSHENINFRTASQSHEEQAFARVNRTSTNAAGFGYCGNPGNSEPQPSNIGKCKADAIFEQDVADIANPRGKHPRTESAGMVNTQSSRQASPRRPQQTQPKRCLSVQAQCLSPAVERSSFGSGGAVSPKIDGRGVSIDSGYHSFNSSFEVNSVNFSRLMSIPPDRYESSTPIKNGSFSYAAASFPYKGAQILIENGPLYELVNERQADQARGNFQNFSSNFLDFENHDPGNLGSEVTAAHQVDLANFDFGLSVAEQNDVEDFGSTFQDWNQYIPQDMISAPKNNESAPHVNDGSDLQTEYFDFENLPEDPFHHHHLL